MSGTSFRFIQWLDSFWITYEFEMFHNTKSFL